MSFRFNSFSHPHSKYAARRISGQHGDVVRIVARGTVRNLEYVPQGVVASGSCTQISRKRKLRSHDVQHAEISPRARPSDQLSTGARILRSKTPKQNLNRQQMDGREYPHMYLLGLTEKNNSALSLVLPLPAALRLSGTGKNNGRKGGPVPAMRCVEKFNVSPDSRVPRAVYSRCRPLWGRAEKGALISPGDPQGAWI